MYSTFFGFSGRIGRGYWWLAQLVLIPVVLFGGFFLAGAIGATAKGTAAAGTSIGVGAIVIVLSIVACIWLNASSTVQRYHDRGKQGAWFFVGMIPVIGIFWQIIECGFCSGDDGDNRYGPPHGSGGGGGDYNLKSDDNGYSGGNTSLAKLDDNYLAEYARKIALQQAEARQRGSSGQSFGNGGSAPVFGKR
jgi:uncharacterized membrane protein YhaH (DUF805 family)